MNLALIFDHGTGVPVADFINSVGYSLACRARCRSPTLLTYLTYLTRVILPEDSCPAGGRTKLNNARDASDRH